MKALITGNHLEADQLHLEAAGLENTYVFNQVLELKLLVSFLNASLVPLTCLRL